MWMALALTGKPTVECVCFSLLYQPSWNEGQERLPETCIADMIKSIIQQGTVEQDLTDFLYRKKTKTHISIENVKGRIKHLSQLI